MDPAAQDPSSGPSRLLPVLAHRDGKVTKDRPRSPAVTFIKQFYFCFFSADIKC